MAGTRKTITLDEKIEKAQEAVVKTLEVKRISLSRIQIAENSAA